MEEEKFIEVFASIFDDVEVDSISMDTKFREIDEWGSLNALVLLSVVEEEYGVALNNQELTNAQSVNDLFVLIRSKKS